MLQIYILKINNESNLNDFKKLLCFVSDEKKARIHRFLRPEDAFRSLSADVMVRYALCKRLGVKNKDLIFSTNEYGKPNLLTPRGTHFNISHSKNWVICAIDDNPVGIDVEVTKSIDYKIAKEFFSSDEYSDLMLQPEEMRSKYFYLVWTLKESYVKAEGKGFHIPFNSFSIRIDSHNVSGIMKGDIIDYNFLHSWLDEKTVCGLCAKEIKNRNYIYLTTEQIIKSMNKMM